MGTLKENMTHAEAAAHMREEVTSTANREVRPLLSLPNGEGQSPTPGYFNVVRAVLSDTDYLGALYGGWPQNPDKKQIATTGKAISFIEEVYAPATGNPDYAAQGALLYKTFRMGTIRLRQPKTFENANSSTPYLSWVLMDGESGHLEPTLGGDEVHHLKLKQASASPGETLLPVSVRQLFEDFLVAVEYFAAQLDAERVAGDTAMLDRWQESANVIVERDTTDILW